MSEGNQCDYQFDMDISDGGLSTDACTRPVWEDHDRCVIHATVDGKTKQLFEDLDIGPDDSLDGAYLRNASISGVDWFAGMSMVGADLTGADLRGSDFSETNLMLSRMSEINGLNADFSDANLEGVIFTNADLRHATLEGARLHETVLTNVHIGGGTKMGDVSVYDRENAPPELTDDRPLEAAAWAYRQLQQLYQRNGLPTLARRSYYLEKDARRRLAWRERKIPSAIKSELSRLIMGYGGSPYRVVLTSAVVMLVCAVLFPLTGGIQEIKEGRDITYILEDPEGAPQWWVGRVFLKSLYFSVVTFATLGYGDIQPVGPWARFLASAEALVGALLAALLVFVLTRLVTW